MNGTQGDADLNRVCPLILLRPSGDKMCVFVCRHGSDHEVALEHVLLADWVTELEVRESARKFEKVRVNK